jgi:capping protein (actin filament) muscle Z-line, alpha
VKVNSITTVLSPFNRIESDRYFVADSQQEFSYDHSTGEVSDVKEGNVSQTSQGKEVSSALAKYVSEHYPSQSGYGVFPQQDGSLAIAVVDSRYNPSNFWNGRWKAHYIIDGTSIKGKIELDVHYFEDGNVRLKTSKNISGSINGSVVAEIASLEKKYQDEVNRTLVGLNDGAFKSLRRQLPVTRSKMTWGKAIGNYRLGQDIAGEDK